MNRRDPATERLWFSVTVEAVDDLGVPFTSPHAAVRHHGGIVAYYSGHNGTEAAAIRAARESIPGRVDAICGVWRQPDTACGLFKGPEDA